MASGWRSIPGSSDRDSRAAIRRPSISSRFAASASVSAWPRSRSQSPSVSGRVSTMPSAVASVTTASQTASAAGSIIDRISSSTVAAGRMPAAGSFAQAATPAARTAAANVLPRGVAVVTGPAAPAPRA